MNLIKNNLIMINQIINIKKLIKSKCINYYSLIY